MLYIILYINGKVIMWKFFLISFIYIAAIILLIVFKCWMILGTIYGLGIVILIYSIIKAKKCPEEFEDLFE